MGGTTTATAAIEEAAQAPLHLRRWRVNCTGVYVHGAVTARWGEAGTSQSTAMQRDGTCAPTTFEVYTADVRCVRGQQTHSPATASVTCDRTLSLLVCRLHRMKRMKR